MMASLPVTPSPPRHACPPAAVGTGLLPTRSQSTRPCMGVRESARAGAEACGCRTAGNQECVRIPPTSALSKRLQWGGVGGGEEEMGEGDRKEDREEEKEQEQEKRGMRCATHPRGWENPEFRGLLLPRRKQERSPPRRCSPWDPAGEQLRTRCYSSAHGLLAGARVYAL